MAALIETKDTQTSNLFENGILLNVEFKRFGNSKKVDADLIDVNADKDLLAVSKKLLKSEELEAIKKHDAQTRALISAFTIPCTIVRSGIYLIGVKSIEKVDEILKQRIEERQSLVNKFVFALPRLKAEAIGELRALHNEADYKSDLEIASMFSLTYRFIEVQTPGKLKGISKEIYQAELQKAEAEIRNARDEAILGMRESFAKLASHLAEILKPNENGKAKKFQYTSIAHVVEYLELFNQRNIFNDQELEALVTKSRSIISGIDAESLRKNEALRDSVQASMAKVAGQLIQLVETVPKRNIKFGTPEPEVDPYDNF